MLENRKKGMTLIEVILAMAILGIIAIVFISMFTHSLIWIFAAGNKGEAYSKAQKYVEKSIAVGDSYETDDLELKFGDETYSIRGGLVESTQSSMQRDSTLKTFVPFIPTISLNPNTRTEGDLTNFVRVTGKYTNFDKGITKVELLDSSGAILIDGDIIPLVLDGTNLEFHLENKFGETINLLNSEYVIRVTTSHIPDSDDEVSRARYIVEQARFMIVGENKVYISSNGLDWINRTELPGLSPTNYLNAIASNFNSYVIVGDNGSVYYSKNNEGWKSITAGTGEKLNDIVWSSSFRKFYIVGENGSVYSSEGGERLLLNGTAGKPLNGIETTIFTDGTSIITAVGADVIFTSEKGNAWNLSNINGITLNAVSSGNERIIAVGYKEAGNGIIIDTISKENFLDDGFISALNDIVYINGSSNYSFISVGNDGYIYRIKSDLGGGLNLYSYEKLSNDNLVSIYSQSNEVIIISDQGQIYYSNDNGLSFTEEDNLSIELKSANGK